MAYEQRRMGRQKVRYNSDNDDNALSYQLVVDGEKVTPDSATIAIYKPGSTTAVLAATAMTVSGTLMTYTVDTTTVANFPVDDGYRADIVVTYDSKTWDRHIVFDVVSYLLDLNIGWDQLVAFDDGLRGGDHNGDEDLSPLIEACRDVLQTWIESKVLNDGALIENMILDNSRVATAARFYILYRYWFNKGAEGKYEKYKEDFDTIWDFVLSSIKYDNDQDGQESGEIGGLNDTLLVT